MVIGRGGVAKCEEGGDGCWQNALLSKPLANPPPMAATILGFNGAEALSAGKGSFLT